MEAMQIALSLVAMVVAMWALYEAKHSMKVARTARHSLKKVEPALLQEQHRKMVANHNAMAQDLQVMKLSVENINRQANALGLKRITSGVVPPPQETSDS
jgi:hypothetical protein